MDEALAAALRDKFFKQDAAYLASDHGRADFANHLHARTQKYRALYRDWILALLVGRRQVLEVGIGTGCASLMLAESGCALDGIEMEGTHAEIAQLRLAGAGQAYGRVLLGNAAEILQSHPLGGYDAVIFWATLEHMTQAERQAALRAVWSGLRPGALLMVLECPNRLWYRDTHTSTVPFFHWLPDALAWQLYAGGGELELARAGRGASYHEFQLAGIPVSVEASIDSLQRFRRGDVLRRLKWLLAADGRYERWLHRLAGGVHREFFHEYLDLAIGKPGPAS